MHKSSSLSNLKVIVGIILLWVLVICIIDPVGDFPLNDDWCYGKSVQTFVHTGKLKVYNWGEMTLVAHVAWGYAFAKIFGFSFTVLRISTLVLAVLSSIGVYTLSQLLGLDKKWGVLTTLLFTFNPIFLELSFTFMTDVPFLFTTIWSIYFYLKYSRSNTHLYLVIAILFTVWGFLIRQLALILPICWLLAFLLVEKITLRRLVTAVLPIMVLALVYYTYTWLMQSIGLLQLRYNNKLAQVFDMVLNPNKRVLLNFPGYFFVVLAYIGVFYFPLLFILLRKQWLKNKFIAIMYTAIIGGFIVLLCKSIPSLDNILVDVGVGPITLADHYGNVTETPNPQGAHWMWVVITFIGVLGSYPLIKALQEFLSNITKRRTFEQVFSFSYVGIYLLPFLIVGIYDRYIIVLLPLILMFVAEALMGFTLKRRETYFGFVFILMLGTFSLCAVHDYLSWNRVRWSVLNDKLHGEYIPEQIDGGIEYTAWNLYDENIEHWWETLDPKVKLVFEPEQNEGVLSSYSYSRWLPGEGVIHVVRVNPKKMVDEDY